MQTLCSASVPLLMGPVRLLTGLVRLSMRVRIWVMLLGMAAGWPLRAFAAGAPAKVHTVVFGAVRKVPYTPAGGSGDAAGKGGDEPMLKVRALLVDGRQKEWTTGDAHDVTDRSFTVRRAMRLNDALPGDAAARWSWQPGPWLLVDRITGHIAALHLPDFDEEVSEAVWFRDYAAYCGTAETAKGGLFAIVAQLGVRRAVVQKQLGKWPQEKPAQPVCRAAVWQREPMRVTMQATGGEAMTFEVVGAASLVEEGDAEGEDGGE
ncbi:MAG: hypothetical protein ABR910_17620 [Acidobacteriaceae bacterium]|jgi:hypothetical protein